MAEPQNIGASVELRGLTKRYPGVPTPAVDGIDLTIKAGEFMTFLGPSGSGKTTTLNMIAGFVETTSGEILIRDEDVSRVPTHARNVGVVFQNYSLFPHMTVAANIAYPLKRRGVPKAEIERRVREALEMVHLGAMANRNPKALSGGQQQRVALARALVFRPPLLLLDEPLGALDKNLRGAMQQEIKRLHHELGTTFVFVTHDQEEALAMSDRIAVFDDGVIQQVGTGDELYERPDSLFIARFLGESNVIRGAAVSSGPETQVELAGCRFSGRVPRPLAIGEEAAVVVRPERVLLNEATPFALDAEVVAITNFGTHRIIRVRADGFGEITVRRPAGAASVSEGEAVRVGWRDEHVALLAAPASM